MLKNIDIRLSENFMLSEFLRSDVAKKKKIFNQYAPSYTTLLNLQGLVSHVLQPLRTQVGKVVITSGYRCPELNKAVGGADNSQHMSGKAVDLKCADMTGAVDVIKILPFDQLIIYPDFIHVSYVHERLRRQIIKKTL